MNKKTFAWFLVILVLVLLGTALILLLGARRTSNTDPVPTAGQTPASTSEPPAATIPPADENAAMIDIVWQWTQLNDQGGMTTVPDPANYTLTFRSDDSFTGTADCNGISGTYSTRNGFSVNVQSTTTAFCGEDSLDALFLSTLAEVVAGGPDGAGGFALETAAGAKRMEFRSGGSAP